MSEWQTVDTTDLRTLPELDVPVWLYDAKDDLGPFVGCRSDSGDGWLWCRCYDDFYWDKKWIADGSEEDDLNITHWTPLPEPPHRNEGGMKG
jgi:hypothetical protein